MRKVSDSGKFFNFHEQKKYSRLEILSAEEEKYYDEKYDHENSIEKINTVYSLLTLSHQDLIQCFSSPMLQEETPCYPHERAYQQAQAAAEADNILESVVLLYSSWCLGSYKASQIFFQAIPFPFTQRDILFDERNVLISVEEQFAYALYRVATGDDTLAYEQLKTLILNLETQSDQLQEAHQINLLATAHTSLAWMYQKGRVHNGKSQPENDREAVRLYTLAAAQGDARAHNNLACMYQKGQVHNGKSQPENDREAVRLYTLAAAQGDARAHNNLACTYHGGRVHNGKSQPENDREAVRLYTFAAAQGSATAHNNLAHMYQGGRVHNGKSQPENDREAVRLYTLAAAQGDATAHNNLGRMYQKGRVHNGKSQPENDREGVRLYTFAAAQGSATAAWNLFLFFKKNHDLDQAYRWLGVAGRLYLRQGATNDYNEVIQELQTEAGKDHSTPSSGLSLSLISDDEVERVFIEALTNTEDEKYKIYFTQLLHEISASPFRIGPATVKEKLCKLVAPKNPNDLFTCLDPLQQGLLLAHQLSEIHAQEQLLVEQPERYFELLSGISCRNLFALLPKNDDKLNDMLFNCLSYFISLSSLILIKQGCQNVVEAIAIVSMDLQKANQGLLASLLVKLATAGQYSLPYVKWDFLERPSILCELYYTCVHRQLQSIDPLEIDEKSEENFEGKSSLEAKEKIEEVLDVRLLMADSEGELCQQSFPKI